MTTLISLISDQLIPNLLFIKEKQQIVHRHIFITTQWMEAKGAADRLARVAGLDAQRWEKVLVVEDSLEDIKLRLTELNLPQTDLYLVNLTGGTKIMSIGVNRFFEGYDHESYYAAIGKNAYKKVFPIAGEQNEHTFSHQLSLEEYLNAYGFRILSTGLPEWASKSLSNRFYNLNRNWKERNAVRELNKWKQIPENKGRPFKKSDNPGLEDLIDRYSWATLDNNYLLPEEINFLVSAWWEAYVYYKLKAELNLPDGAIHISCKIAREDGTAPNELDVTFVYNNKLFVVECKTGFGESRFLEEFNKAMYKMAAIRKDMGLRIPGYLFILDPYLRKSGQVKQNYADRAKVMDTTLVDKVILNSHDEWQAVLDTIK